MIEETMGALEQTIAEYRSTYGEPEYRYFKREMIWAKVRRKPGYHIGPIGNGIEVTKAEYDANVAASKHARGEAFMGRFPQRYWDYHCKLSKDGWREKLIADIQAVSAERE
jgi:hypothetical protein